MKLVYMIESYHPGRGLPPLPIGVIAHLPEGATVARFQPFAELPAAYQVTLDRQVYDGLEAARTHHLSQPFGLLDAETGRMRTLMPDSEEYWWAHHRARAGGKYRVTAPAVIDLGIEAGLQAVERLFERFVVDEICGSAAGAR